MNKIIKKITEIKKSLINAWQENSKPFFLSILVILVPILLSNILYQEKHVKKRGYKIDISKDGKRIVKKEKVIDLATALKTADFDRGKKIFRKCASCHNIKKGSGAKVGPNLWAVVNRKKGVTDFSYSKALMQKGGKWDEESINLFIKKPKKYISGTKMAFGGLKKPQARADVILYLQKQR